MTQIGIRWDGSVERHLWLDGPDYVETVGGVEVLRRAATADELALYSPITSLPLPEYQALWVGLVDEETRRRFGEGFVYTGVLISSSEVAQLRVTGAQVGSAALAYPIRWPSRDNTVFVVLAGPADVAALFGACRDFVQVTAQVGADVKAAVAAAVNIAQVDAAVAGYVP
jgi:hypothetical protein